MEHLDPDTVYDWAAIATQFVAEYMDLDVYPGAGADDENGRRRLPSDL